jgi:hypothetical protein
MLRATIFVGNALIASAFSPSPRPPGMAAVAQRAVPDSAAAAAVAAERCGAAHSAAVVGSKRGGVALAAMLAEKPRAMVPGKMSKMEKLRSRYGAVYEPDGGWATVSAESEGFSYADLEARASERGGVPKRLGAVGRCGFHPRTRARHGRT